MCLITIGIPVFNDAEFIEGSLQSILEQTFGDFLLIISDDGSSDGSEAICREYASKDSRIKFFRQAVNLGISKNMKFLLSMARSKYFMWAADDDLWAPDFVEKLVAELEKKPEAVAAFCNYQLINEKDEPLGPIKQFDYSDNKVKKRLGKFIRKADDAFGYGIFRWEDILEVEFPVWWWPNKKSAYNNIYPSLCYYLAKGEYAHLDGPPLFFKRVKTGEKTHHVISYYGNSIKETLAYFIRRFNLVVFSTREVLRAKGLSLALWALPKLFYHWFVLSSLSQIKLASSAFWNNRILRKKKASF